MRVMVVRLEFLDFIGFSSPNTVRLKMALRRNLCFHHQEEKIRAVKTDEIHYRIKFYHILFKGSRNLASLSMPNSLGFVLQLNSFDNSIEKRKACTLLNMILLCINPDATVAPSTGRPDLDPNECLTAKQAR